MITHKKIAKNGKIKKMDYLWDTPKNARHSVRLICDEMKLPYSEKNILCKCLEIESGFDNNVTPHKNLKSGRVWSTDYGICQINDWFHIGEGKDFPSVDFVLANPDICVRWMVKLWLEGHQDWWSSYRKVVNNL